MLGKRRTQVGNNRPCITVRWTGRGQKWWTCVRVGFKEVIWIRKIAPTIERDEEPTD